MEKQPTGCCGKACDQLPECSPGIKCPTGLFYSGTSATSAA